MDHADDVKSLLELAADYLVVSHRILDGGGRRDNDPKPHHTARRLEWAAREIERLREELWIARRHGIEHEWELNEDFYFCCQVCGVPAPPNVEIPRASQRRRAVTLTPPFISDLMMVMDGPPDRAFWHQYHDLAFLLAQKEEALSEALRREHERVVYLLRTEPEQWDASVFKWLPSTEDDGKADEQKPCAACGALNGHDPDCPSLLFA